MKALGQYKLSLRARARRLREQKLLDRIFAETGEILDSASLRRKLGEELERSLSIIREELSKILYHWYDEPPSAYVELNAEKFKQLLEEFNLSWRAIIPEGRKTVKIKVGELLELCKRFGLDPNLLEERAVFTRKFPVNLRSRALIKLKTHILNEGSISLRTNRRQPKAKYINKDPALHKYVMDLLRQLGAPRLKPPKYREDKNAYVTYLDSATARILHRAGIPIGAKTVTNPSLDPKVYVDPELQRYHFQATLTEEGTSIVRVKGRRVAMRISWARGIDITDKLTEEQKEKLKEIIGPVGRIALGKLMDKIEDEKMSSDILEVIERNKPKLINEEVALLNQLYKKQVEPRFVEAYPERMQLSKEGRFTVLWRAYMDKPKAIDIIVREYGALPGTWKDERLRRQYEIFLKYRGRKLREKEIIEIKKQINSIPSRMPKEWRVRKFEEIFGRIAEDIK